MTIHERYLKNRKLNVMIMNMTANIYRQDYKAASRKLIEIISYLKELIEFVQRNKPYFIANGQIINSSYVEIMLTKILEAQENEDYILLACLMEEELKPFIAKIQLAIHRQEGDAIYEGIYEKNMAAVRKFNPELAEMLAHHIVEEPERYHFEPTGVEYGAFLVSEGEKQFYLHSLRDPQGEGRRIVEESFPGSISRCIVLGYANGYHVAGFLHKNPKLVLDVYEPNLDILKLTMQKIARWGMFEIPNFKLHYDPLANQFFNAVKSENKELAYFIYRPSVRAIPNRQVREKIEEFLEYKDTVASYKPLLTKNFEENVRNIDTYVDELKKAFDGKTVYIVAAGPSLDKNVRLLKTAYRKGIILATAAVYKKLIHLGIKPDYIIETDPKKTVYAHVEKYEFSIIPMILLSTVYERVAAQYRGQKYLVCQKDYQPAEEYAKKKGVTLYETGGSTSTLAFDVALKLGAGKIIFLGLDLAYTGNISYADDTAYQNIPMPEKLLEVSGMYGEKVKTSQEFLNQIQWLEQRVKEAGNTQVINATEGGAVILGMKNKKLKYVIE